MMRRDVMHLACAAAHLTSAWTLSPKQLVLPRVRGQPLGENRIVTLQ